MNKRYTDLLAYYIKKSGMSLRQIACRCQEKGHKIAPSYISKLQNGHLPPPSEDVSRVLAEVLDGNPEILIYLGYFAKAPSIIRQKLHPEFAEISFDVYLFARRIAKLPPKYREKIVNELEWLEALEASELST
ncbi:MAG TPA: helix-turn-helix domain-containing protein [Methylomusa anaerophila]|uniref:HTH cro/C1-type domain-containing protein n=1 Tax=Methylomusa anaerophila TaxID=1930071 RepID=A0A348AIS0_9FIRM|nr:helix-turn-helix domain-containing protein [Methylomusa anaerophila]BBB90968.1 hypothetical protein MAMMFC1_01635 [Methylomusa anaerophila]HML90404.1 helix-turn-helix domain-containing protein [Methylomusa anaerophila]